MSRSSSDSRSNPARGTSKPVLDGERELLSADAFKRRFSVERKRTERSTKPFLLMLLETGQYHSRDNNQKVFANIASALLSSTRETDVIGWYKDQSILGAIFTELIIYDKSSLLSTMLSRVSSILSDNLTFEQFNQISISFHFFPDKWDDDANQRPSNPTLYPDLSTADNNTRLLSDIKARNGHNCQLPDALCLLAASSRDHLGYQGNFQRPCTFQTTADRSVWQTLYVLEVPIDARRCRHQYPPRVRG